MFSAFPEPFIERSYSKATWVLTALCLAFFACLCITVPQLPERVATHFGADGVPNGWMTRAGYVKFTVVFGLCFPLVIVGGLYLVRYLPTNTMNLPRRDYWLAPERRRATYDYIFQHGLCYGCLAIGFVIGLHLLLVHANAQPGQRLELPWMLALAGTFLAGTIIWAIALKRHFRRSQKAVGENKR